MSRSLPKHWASHTPKRSPGKMKHRVNTSSKASNNCFHQNSSTGSCSTQILAPRQGAPHQSKSQAHRQSTRLGPALISSWFSPTSRNVPKTVYGHLLLGLDPAEGLGDLTSSSWSLTEIPHPNPCCCTHNEASSLPPKIEKWLKKGNHAFTPGKGLMVQDIWHLGVHPTSH